MDSWTTPQVSIFYAEAPTYLRSFAEANLAQARKSVESTWTSLTAANRSMRETYGTAFKTCFDLNDQMLMTAQAGVVAGLDYASALVVAKTIPEMVQATTSHMQRQYAALSMQSTRAVEMAQKIATESVQTVVDLQKHRKAA